MMALNCTNISALNSLDDETSRKQSLEEEPIMSMEQTEQERGPFFEEWSTLQGIIPPTSVEYATVGLVLDKDSNLPEVQRIASESSITAYDAPSYENERIKPDSKENIGETKSAVVSDFLNGQNYGVEEAAVSDENNSTDSDDVEERLDFSKGSTISSSPETGNDTSKQSTTKWSIFQGIVPQTAAEYTTVGLALDKDSNFPEVQRITSDSSTSATNKPVHENRHKKMDSIESFGETKKSMMMSDHGRIYRVEEVGLEDEKNLTKNDDVEENLDSGERSSNSAKTRSGKSKQSATNDKTIEDANVMKLSGPSQADLFEKLITSALKKDDHDPVRPLLNQRENHGSDTTNHLIPHRNNEYIKHWQNIDTGARDKVGQALVHQTEERSYRLNGSGSPGNTYNINLAIKERDRYPLPNKSRKAKANNEWSRIQGIIPRTTIRYDTMEFTSDRNINFPQTPRISSESSTNVYNKFVHENEHEKIDSKERFNEIKKATIVSDPVHGRIFRVEEMRLNDEKNMDKSDDVEETLDSGVKSSNSVETGSDISNYSTSMSSATTWSGAYVSDFKTIAHGNNLSLETFPLKKRNNIRNSTRRNVSLRNNNSAGQVQHNNKNVDDPLDDIVQGVRKRRGYEKSRAAGTNRKHIRQVRPRHLSGMSGGQYWYNDPSPRLYPVGSKIDNQKTPHGNVSVPYGFRSSSHKFQGDSNPLNNIKILQEETEIQNVKDQMRNGDIVEANDELPISVPTATPQQKLNFGYRSGVESFVPYRGAHSGSQKTVNSIGQLSTRMSEHEKGLREAEARERPEGR